MNSRSVWKKEKGDEAIYIQLYHYYRVLIIKGVLTKGTKLPSIRKCAEERRISRTTVEAAYAQLAAEGYIRAVGGSGYYVGELEYKWIKTLDSKNQYIKAEEEQIAYNFSTGRVDGNSFKFDIWTRYVKSALRNTERLLSYGDPQGEYDLRKEITDYIRERRGVVCTPNQVVVGASMQTLLHILCSLLKVPMHIVFTGSSYKQGKAIFEDRGYQLSEYVNVENYLKAHKSIKYELVYTSPSHTTAWGEVMTMETRLKLLEHVRKQEGFVIEDDYDSEFNYYNRPTPALQGLDGGEQVIYMSTFSKLLLPSLRLSFMVLPHQLVNDYQEKGKYYNQTASKVEQIALCQLIRDGHFEKQVKRAKKLYSHKREILCACVNKIFGEEAEVYTGSGGFLIRVQLKNTIDIQLFEEKLQKQGVLIRGIEQVDSNNKVSLILSCSGVSEEYFETGIRLLYETYKNS